MILDNLKNKYNYKSEGGGGGNHWIAWAIGIIGGLLIVYFFG